MVKLWIGIRIVRIRIVVRLLWKAMFDPNRDCIIIASALDGRGIDGKRNQDWLNCDNRKIYPITKSSEI